MPNLSLNNTKQFQNSYGITQNVSKFHAKYNKTFPHFTLTSWALKTILTVQYNFARQLFPARLVELTENCLERLKNRILRSIRLTNIPAMNHLNERQCDGVTQLK